MWHVPHPDVSLLRNKLKELDMHAVEEIDWHTIYSSQAEEDDVFLIETEKKIGD